MQPASSTAAPIFQWWCWVSLGVVHIPVSTLLSSPLLSSALLQSPRSLIAANTSWWPPLRAESEIRGCLPRKLEMCELSSPVWLHSLISMSVVSWWSVEIQDNLSPDTSRLVTTRPMPPMSESMDIFAGQTRKTNFSIDAIMSTPKIKQEEGCEDDIDVGKEEIDNDIIEPDMIEKIKKEPNQKKRISGKSNSPTLDDLKCSLENKDLWDKFSEFGTEMIITRTGRRMFPTVRCSFANVDKMSVSSGAKFHVLLDIVPADNKRYRYAYHRSQWLVAGKADPAPLHRLYPHPDGPFSLDQLRKQVTSFEKVKITNNESDNSGQVRDLYSQTDLQFKPFILSPTLQWF